MIERFELFSNSIFKISKIWHKVATEEMSKFGLNAAHLIYIIALYRNKKGLNASDLSKISDKDKSDVSRSLNLLLKKGIVEKRKNNSKIYGSLFYLMDDGIAVAEEIFKKIETVMIIANKNIGDEKRRYFYEILESFTKNISEIAESGISDKGIYY